MNVRHSHTAILLLLSIVTLCTCVRNNNVPDSDITYSALINHEILDSLINSTNPPILIDVRKRKEYLQGHIPNARNLWRPQIQDTTHPVEGIMATKEQMENVLSSLGVLPEDLIVIYDAKGNPDAARLWWILNYYGHEKIALFDGGFPCWTKNNLPIENSAILNTPTKYRFNGNRNLKHYADYKSVAKAINDTNTILLDTRSSEEFTGQLKKGNAMRAGRIPSSININYNQVIRYDKGCTFKSLEELESLYNSNKITPDKTIIAYCQSGVRSAHTTFVLTQILGFKNVKNYDGSWLEWSSKTELPIIQDSTITVSKQ